MGLVRTKTVEAVLNVTVAKCSAKAVPLRVRLHPPLRRVLFLCTACVGFWSGGASANGPVSSVQSSLNRSESSSTKRRTRIQAEEGRGQSDLAAISPDTSSRRKAHSKRWRKDRVRIKGGGGTQSQNLGSADGSQGPHAKTVEVFGGIGGTVYLYETQSSVDPDFITGVADLGLAGSSGPFSGRLSLSITDGGDDVAVSQAFVNVSSAASTSRLVGVSLKLGRDDLPGVAGYGAAFNHGSLGSGNSDGAFLGAGLKGGALLEWNTGGGVVNALSEDVSTGFGKRSQHLGKAWFAWSHLTVGFVRLEFAYARQNNQMRAEDDEKTSEIDESRFAPFSLSEGSLGVLFDWIEVGGFVSRRVVGDEKGLAMDEKPLAVEMITDNWGGGVKLKTGTGLLTDKLDRASLAVGYSTSTRLSGSKKLGSESVIATTLGYAFGPAALDLNLGLFEGRGDQVYTDERSSRSHSRIQRVGLDFSYTFSK